MKVLLLCIACLATLSHCMGQEFKDRKSFTMDVSKLERFHLYNRRGAVTVKAVSGNTATLEVTRSLRGGRGERLEKAKEEIYMDSMRRGGELVFFVQHPYLKLEFNEDGYGYYNTRDRQGWNWNSDKDEVKVEFEVTLNIPAQTDLTVTSHEHPLKISGMQADLRASNHHDGVWVENQGGSADVHSHHGDVEVFYSKNPTRDCKYDTHHGNIRIHYQQGLSAEASLYSYHGEFFTDFDWKLQPMTVSNEAGGKGTQYRIRSNSGTNVQIGGGGPLQQFRSHHGNIYLLNKQ